MKLLPCLLLTACAVPPSERPAPPGPTRAVFRSPPAVDWPCGVDELTGGDLRERAFTYGGPSACLLPIDVVADGVLGCATGSRTIALPGERVVDEVAYRYDVRGRLVELRRAGTRSTFVWEGEQLLARTDRTRDDAVTIRYLERGDTIELLDDATLTAALRVDGAHPAELVAAEARTTYRWAGGRLARYDRPDAHLRPLYDCR